jgi:hypothetical protein
VDYNNKVLLKLLENYKSLKEDNKKAYIRKQVKKSIILYIYKTKTDKNNLLLSEILYIHYSWIRREIV